MIPKPPLKKVKKPVFHEDGSKYGKTNGIMLNADGDYVVMQPEFKSWMVYLVKQNAVGGVGVYLQSLPAEPEDWACGIYGWWYEMQYRCHARGNSFVSRTLDLPC